jgi:hypothetical protein
MEPGMRAWIETSGGIDGTKRVERVVKLDFPVRCTVPGCSNGDGL